jgi:hypothetical protein
MEHEAAAPGEGLASDSHDHMGTAVPHGQPVETMFDIGLVMINQDMVQMPQRNPVRVYGKQGITRAFRAQQLHTAAVARINEIGGIQVPARGKRVRPHEPGRQRLVPAAAFTERRVQAVAGVVSIPALKVDFSLEPGQHRFVG